MGRKRSIQIVERNGVYGLRVWVSNDQRPYVGLGRITREQAEQEREKMLAALEQGTWRHPREIEIKAAVAAQRHREDGATLQQVEEECAELLDQVRSARIELWRDGIRARESCGLRPLNRARGLVTERKPFRELRAKGKRHKLVESERVAWDHYTTRGWELLRNGWPDFLGIAPTGEIIGIEVKGPGDKLKPEQQDMAGVLAAAGVDTTVAYVVAGTVVVTNAERDMDDGSALQARAAEDADAARLDAHLARHA